MGCGHYFIYKVDGFTSFRRTAILNSDEVKMGAAQAVAPICDEEMSKRLNRKMG